MVYNRTILSLKRGEKVRLDKYISDAMQISRTDAKKQIAKGNILVDGIVCYKPELQLKKEQIVSNLQQQTICRDDFVYIMVNKPSGVVSASNDKRDKTVVDLVAGKFARRNLFPAGRLDKTSTGFILLTDDGGFSHNILSPKNHIEKEYIVTLDTPFTSEMQKGFLQGVTLADGTVLAPAQAIQTENPFVVRVILTQGVYHQIKRMFGVYQAGVNELHRIRMGKLFLDQSLKPGEWRILEKQEIQKIIQR